MNLENFIAENRAAFDRAEPPGRVWQAVEAALEAKKEKPKRKIFFLPTNFKMMAAAASLVLFGAVAGWFFGQKGAEKGEPEIALATFSPEAAEAERYFSRQINSKKAALASQPFHSDQVEKDLDAIDQAMAELKSELANVAPDRREQVVNALIENYKIKLSILERVLDHAEPKASDSIEPHNKKSHEQEHI